MQTLVFDGRMGASGDMLLGVLVDLGADPSVLTTVEEELAVSYSVDTTTKNGIAATRVRVLTDEDADDHSGHHSAHEHHHDHTHDHEQSHDAHDRGDDRSHEDHDHDQGHSHEHAEGSGPLRTYSEVIELVDAMDLPASVTEQVSSVFHRLGTAEASVHGTTLERTHFHEVGADDAIADVVGVSLLLETLSIDRVLTTPVATGGGTVSMSHGTYPVPAPAVFTIASEADWQLTGGPVDYELLTPTGAAILAEIASGVPDVPTLDVETVGYGAGGYDVPDHPNVLRGTIGETTGQLGRDSIRQLETNVDDVAPEILGGLSDSLVDAGARDVSIIPTTMKKSRPGHIVRVLVKPADTERVAHRLAVETGTLGIRETSVRHRFVADRSFETATITIDDSDYEVPVKVATDTDGAVYDYSAEYDDAAAIATETGRPVRAIMDAAERQFESTLE